MIVVVHHLKELIGWAPSQGWGAVGVSFFFVLSGFVLTLNYQKILTYNDAGKFLWRRLVRLYPLYIVTLFISIFVIHFYKIKLDRPCYQHGGKSPTPAILVQFLVKFTLLLIP